MYIYKLVFKGGETYVGKTSRSIPERYKEHCKDIIGNTHCNHKILTTYEKYKELPSIHLVEECTYEVLNNREVYWIKELNAYTEGLNCTKGGDGPASGEDNPSAKYTLDDYVAVLYFIAYTEDMSLRQISEELDVSLKVVEHISSCTSHQYLKEIHPIEYSILENKLRSKVYKYPRSYTYPNLKGPDGTIYTINNLLRFSKEHSLDNSSLSKLIKGRLLQVKGFTLETTKLPKVISPTNEIFEIPVSGISAFCREHNLSTPCLGNVIRGNQIQHKGWKLYNE